MQQHSIHNRVHKTQPLKPTLNQLKPVHVITSYLKLSLLLSYSLGVSIPFSLLLHAFIISDKHAICPTHPTFLYLITL